MKNRHDALRQLKTQCLYFLRRMAAINDVGMPLSDAIKSITKINLGVLSTEVKLMYKDIVWSNSVLGALTKFERRVRTISISRIITLITKASESTGNIKETLRVAANEATLADKLKKQKFTVLFSYLIVVYMSFRGIPACIICICNHVPSKDTGYEFNEGSGMLMINSQKVEYTFCSCMHP